MEEQSFKIASHDYRIKLCITRMLVSYWFDYNCPEVYFQSGNITDPNLFLLFNHKSN